MPWYVYIALKQLFPSGRFFSLFSFLSLMGVGIGVWMLVVVQSVMNGFGVEIRNKLVDTSGHVRIESGGIIFDHERITEKVRALPNVEAVAPYAEGVVMLQHANRPAFPFIRGLDVRAEEQVVPLEDYVLMGDLKDLNNNRVFLSSGLATSIGAYVGSTVDIYSPLMLERLKRDEILLPYDLEVAGIFETGYGAVDGNTVVVTLRLMQELYGLNEGVHGIAVRLTSRDLAEGVKEVLNTEVLESPDRAMSWLDAHGDLLFVLRLEKTTMFFIIVVISIVAAFSITISLFTAVLRKTREIGLFGALGGTPMQAAAIFCLQGFIIGVLGTLLGVGSAVLFLHYRNNIIHLLAKVTQSESVLVRFYQFTDLPLHYSKMDFVVIITFAIITSTLAGLVPAWRASRLKPSEALRNE